jgi:hypothetical protein
MPYAAISYRIKPGHDDEIAKIFGGTKRVTTPVLRDEQGEEIGKLLGTAVFIQDDVLVRVIHYEGDFAAIGRHMGQQQTVHLLEAQMAPFLAESRDTTDTGKFAQHFRNAGMRQISELSVDTLPEN